MTDGAGVTYRPANEPPALPPRSPPPLRAGRHRGGAGRAGRARGRRPGDQRPGRGRAGAPALDHPGRRHLLRRRPRAAPRAPRAARRSPRGSVRLKKPTRSRTHDGRRYDVGVWTSPWVTESFAFTELIPSWQATTPGDSWIEVKARVRARRRDAPASWDTHGPLDLGQPLGPAHHPRQPGRRPGPGRGRHPQDATTPRAPVGWQLKVQLMRRSGTRTAPVAGPGRRDGQPGRPARRDLGPPGPRPAP